MTGAKSRGPRPVSPVQQIHHATPSYTDTSGQPTPSSTYPNHHQQQQHQPRTTPSATNTPVPMVMSTPYGATPVNNIWANGGGTSLTPRLSEQRTPSYNRTPRAGSRTPRAGSHTPRTGGHTPRTGGHTPRHGDRTPRLGQTPRAAAAQTPRDSGHTPHEGSRTPYDSSSTPVYSADNSDNLAGQSPSTYSGRKHSAIPQANADYAYAQQMYQQRQSTQQQLQQNTTGLPGATNIAVTAPVTPVVKFNKPASAPNSGQDWAAMAANWAAKKNTVE